MVADGVTKSINGVASQTYKYASFPKLGANVEMVNTKCWTLPEAAHIT